MVRSPSRPSDVEHGLVAVEGVEMQARRAAREHVGGDAGGVRDAELGLGRGIRLDLEVDRELGGRLDARELGEPAPGVQGWSPA